MFSEIFGGIRIALRNWPIILSLGGFITLASVALTFLAADVFVQLSVLNGGQEMREKSVTIFTPYYDANGVVNIGEKVFAELDIAITENSGYTTVINNVQIDNPMFSDGVPVIFVFGEAVSEIIHNVQFCSPAPCFMRGADVSSVSPRGLQLGLISIPEAERLPRSSTFFDANMGIIPLDNRILVMLTNDFFSQLTPYEREEATARAVFFGETSIDTEKYIEAVADDGLFLIPHQVAISQPKRMSQLMVMSAMYVVGLLVFLSLVIFAYVSVAERTLRKEREMFSIRRAHGATPIGLALRLAGFVASVLLILPLPMLIFLQIFPEPVPLLARLVMLLLFIIAVTLWGYFVKNKREVEL